MEANLGDRVRDKITGCQGIVIAVTNWLHGCTRVTVQPEEKKDGKPVDNFCVDSPQAEVLEVSAIVVQEWKEFIDRKHGDREDVRERKDSIR